MYCKRLYIAKNKLHNKKVTKVVTKVLAPFEQVILPPHNDDAAGSEGLDREC